MPSLPEIAENNVLDLEQNANGTEVLQEKPKKGKGRPRKVHGALENSPKCSDLRNVRIKAKSNKCIYNARIIDNKCLFFLIFERGDPLVRRN